MSKKKRLPWEEDPAIKARERAELDERIAGFINTNEKGVVSQKTCPCCGSENCEKAERKEGKGISVAWLCYDCGAHYPKQPGDILVARAGEFNLEWVATKDTPAFSSPL